MNKQFIQVTNGLLPVAVLALLAVAFIAGQARANMPSQFSSASAPAFPTIARIIATADMLKTAESLPTIVSTFMTLPGEIELSITLLGKSSKHDGAITRPGLAQ